MTSRRDKLSELTTAESLDSGRELVAALNPWINNGSHPSFLGLANGNESGMREAYDPGAYRTLQALRANLLCTTPFCSRRNVALNSDGWTEARSSEIDAGPTAHSIRGVPSTRPRGWRIGESCTGRVRNRDWHECR